jgi:integrase
MSKQQLQQLDAFINDSKPTEAQLSKKVDEMARSNDPTVRTISTRYSKLKKRIRDNHPSFSDKFLRELNPPKEMTQAIIVENKVRRNAKKLVDFDDDLIGKIYALKDSDSPYDRAAYLEFVSGRRISEIHGGEFGRLSKSHPREVRMRLSKKKDDKAYKFDLLKDTIDAKDFKAAVLKVRSATHGMSMSDFTSRVNRVVKKDVRKDLSSHDLRAMYAVYRFETDNPDRVNLTGYIGDVLNHEDSSDAGIAYSNFNYVRRSE